jgi:CHAT domain-containing protein
LDLGRIEEAISSFDQALTFKLDSHEAWNNRGIALENLGRFEEAISSYDQALTFKPDDHKAWVNRGKAAANSLGYEPFWQQQFAAGFRSEVSKAPQRLIPALEAIDQEYCLAQFQASLSANTALLLETLAHLDAPNLIALIGQPLSPQHSQLIRQSSPQKLIEFIQQPISEAVVARLEQDSLTHPPRLNPQLNQRGYEGRLASYQAELDKAIDRHTHPEGWGYLHYQIGRAHYFRGRKDIHPSPFWRKAEMSYKTALQTLNPPEFEQLHLDVLQDLIRVLLDLGETEAARELQRQGADLLRRMLTDPKRTERQKQEIALKSAVFNQLSVDLTLQSGDISGALTLAETGKNTCLRWLLGTGEVPTFDYAQFQHLLTPTTAAIYWHLSPSALTTFVILPNEPTPIVVERAEVNLESLIANPRLNDQRPASLQQILVWEKWLTEWNQRYQAYGSSKLKKDTTPIEQGDKKQHPWRTRMEESLKHLKQILNIPRIEQELQNYLIDTLILIPHRDLHRFPLHALFDKYTCTYLPSAYLGLQQQTKPQLNALNSLLIVENPKSAPDVTSKAKTLPDLPFAEVEAALIRQMFSEVTAIENPNTTYDQLQKTLPTPHQVFHFTGHAAYNSTNPAQSCLFLHGTDQLTLCDIVRLDLRAYSLTCLAACETAVTGDQTITDEYVGLVSAFLKAGVTYVVSTLWTVESAATTLFTVEFYQQLHTGQSPKAALKATQTWLKTATRKKLIEWLDAVMPKLSQQRSLKLVLEDLRELLNTMDDTKPPYDHPYYWAAFTISGL